MSGSQHRGTDRASLSPQPPSHHGALSDLLDFAGPLDQLVPLGDGAAIAPHRASGFSSPSTSGYAHPLPAHPNYGSLLLSNGRLGARPPAPGRAGRFHRAGTGGTRNAPSESGEGEAGEDLSALPAPFTQVYSLFFMRKPPRTPILGGFTAKRGAVEAVRAGGGAEEARPALSNVTDTGGSGSEFNPHTQVPGGMRTLH